ncbi:hypothetical protein NMG60_11026909 [Bertholletia excelsa]
MALTSGIRHSEAVKTEDDESYYCATQKVSSSSGPFKRLFGFSMAAKPMEVSSDSGQRQERVQAPAGKRVLKEKRARLYIIRRCVCMLLCWRKHED